ncbi:MAG: sulfotransferase [Proteobacteria bacterium]|nr:sulfotransferase [Pseudomonadota bacterium]
MSRRTRVTSQDYRRPHRPLPVAALNALGRAAARVGGRVPLTEASLVAAARRSTGLHFFRDTSFREPLRRLVASLEGEAALHPFGRLIARQGLVRVLANRLRAEALRDRHPEIDATPVTAPVFIAGLQRTGTTLLHRLLALEPALRPLLSWEALNPAPLADPAPEPDPRVRIAEIAERSLRYLAPDFFAIHPVEAHSPEEDVLLLDLCFLGTTPEASQHVPSFAAWLEAQDARPAYRDLRRWIQLLLWQSEGRWLGKTPHHLEFLDALFDVFPDARIIHTHRDPQKVVPSFCSMLAHARGIFSDRVDPLEVAAHWSRKQARMVERAIAVREERGPEPFLDVHYLDLVSDPLKQVRRIYDFLGLELRESTLESMRAWLAAHPQHGLGQHRYDPADFGLERSALERTWAPYRERFGIAAE